MIGAVLGGLGSMWGAIIGGIVVMTYFLTIGSKLYKTNPEQLSNRIEVTGIFWHFVDLVWITVFPILYLT